jgi:NOL1/NOP2/fmu family ribosome biogenesis protein
MTGKKLIEEFRKRFGLPVNVFRAWALVEHNEDVFITTPEAASFDAIRPVRKGIRLARIFPHGFKPTTNAIQIFGRYATKNILDLSPDQARQFINGEILELPFSESSTTVTDGFVIIRCDGFALGVGFFKNGVLKSQVPHSRRTGRPDRDD